MSDGAFDALLHELRRVHDEQVKQWQDRLSEVQVKLETTQQIPLEGNQVEAVQYVSTEDSCNITQQILHQSDKLMATDHAAADDGNDRHPMRQLSALSLTGETTEHTVRKSTGTYFGHMIYNEKFEILFASLIIVNAIIMACEAQYTGVVLAVDFGYRVASSRAGEVWPGALSVFEISDWCFGMIFLLELVLKLAASPRRFCKDRWNWFDGIVMLAWAWRKIDIAMGNVTVLRIVRLVRLTRVLRLVRRFEAFDTLFLMTTVISGSVPLMIWACVILILLQLLFALVLFQLLHGFYFFQVIVDEASLTAEHHEMYKYYGSFTRCMLTMFEITLANWPPACRLLVENVSEWFALFAILHKLCVGFAIVGIINGVFMQETFKMAANDDVIMMRQKEKDQRIHLQKMQLLFKASDTSQDGRLDAKEFEAVLSLREVQVWLSAMGLDVSDSRNLFELLASDEGTISAEQLVKGVSRLKGAARSIDVHNLIRQHEAMRLMLDDIRDPGVQSL